MHVRSRSDAQQLSSIVQWRCRRYLQRCVSSFSLEPQTVTTARSELTTTWGGTVAFEHYWTPSLRTSWVFGYLKTEYTDNAKAADQLAAAAAWNR